MISKVLSASAVGLTSFAAASPLFVNTYNGRTSARTATGDAAPIVSMPLKRVHHQGMASPSVANRYSQSDVTGVFGAAYLAEG